MKTMGVVGLSIKYFPVGFDRNMWPSIITPINNFAVAEVCLVCPTQSQQSYSIKGLSHGFVQIEQLIIHYTKLITLNTQ